MKKVSLFLSTLAITIFAFSLVASANEQPLSTNSDNPNDLIYDNLNPGEKVISFYREIIPMNESEMPLDSVALERLPSSIPDNEITPLERRLKWYPMKKSYIGHSYGPWRYAGASSLSGGVLSASHTKTVSNTYSGQLKLPIKSLDKFVGFKVTKSYTAAVSYSSRNLPNIPKKGHRLEYRHVYRKYKVKQERKYDRRGKTYGTAYVYPKKWVERQYRIVEFNAQ